MKGAKVVTMEGLRVFLVDDHPLMKEALRRLLEANEGFLVVGEADSAEEALKQMEVVSADMVVMDIRLPGMDGVEATRQLKARHPDLKVVVVSAFGEEHLLHSIEAGADGYLLKTLAPDELARSLHQAAQGLSPVDTSLTRHLMDHATASEPLIRGSSLSSRQLELLRLVAQGVSSSEQAVRLFISQTTLKREFRNIFDRLGVNDRAHAIAEAYRRQLI